ncbi:MAG: N-acetylmuramoyl-L-alanine amidase [Alphaproteobacteria bacterium]
MRKIEKIILHCTATVEGKDYSVATIRGWHKQRGWNDIGYHYLIRLNGTIEKGRPIERIGAHVHGQNARSIGIAYVGGVDKKLNPKDTRTYRQKAAMKTLVQELWKQFPNATLHGHYEFANKACPSFTVREKDFR